MRMNYTTIGDPVNTAARLESLDKQSFCGTDITGCCILAAESTHELPGGRFRTVPAGCYDLKGMEQSVRVYSVDGHAEYANVFELASDRAMQKGLNCPDLADRCVSLQPGIVCQWSVALVSQPVQRTRDIVPGAARGGGPLGSRGVPVRCLCRAAPAGRHPAGDAQVAAAAGRS